MLRSKYINYLRDDNLYYFSATKDLLEKKYYYRSIAHKTHRTVFSGYSKRKDSDKPAYYRHSAFIGKFLKFTDKWYLEITPSYYFTRDGYNEYKFSDDKIRKIKMLELNMAILGQVVMWSKILQPVLERDLFEKPKIEHIEFGELVKMRTPYGIDDKAWLPKEEKEDLPSTDCEQLLLLDL